MKRVLLILIFLATVTGISAQGLFRPVQGFTPTIDASGLKRINLADFKWQMRFDGTIQLNESLYNKDLKQLESKMVAGVGFAIGFQHYIPDAVGNAINNFGFSLGLLQQNQLKIIGQVNIWQYIKFGPTFTPNQPEPYGKWGFFIGTGITL